MNDNPIIVIPSCDRHFDLWPTLLESYHRFWPECPYRIVVLTNELSDQQGRVTFFPVGIDRGWSANLRAGLERIGRRYVLVHLDDRAFVRRPCVDELDAAVAWAIGSEVDHLRFRSARTMVGYDEFLAQIPAHAPDRVETSFTLWRSSSLNELLVDGETLEGFERAGPTRSGAHRRFFCTRAPMVELVDLLVAGRWEPSAVDSVREAGLHVFFGTRPMLALPEAARRRKWAWNRHGSRLGVGGA